MYTERNSLTMAPHPHKVECVLYSHDVLEDHSPHTLGLQTSLALTPIDLTSQHAVSYSSFLLSADLELLISTMYPKHMC